MYFIIIDFSYYVLMYILMYTLMYPFFMQKAKTPVDDEHVLNYMVGGNVEGCVLVLSPRICNDGVHPSPGKILTCQFGKEILCHPLITMELLSNHIVSHVANIRDEENNYIRDCNETFFSRNTECEDSCLELKLEYSMKMEPVKSKNIASYTIWAYTYHYHKEGCQKGGR
jgi:hypothetical protein